MKRLQVIDLIGNFKVFNQLNYSIPADDIVDVFNEFEKHSHTNNNQFSFKLAMNFYYYQAEIITPYGLCFTFNSVESSKLLNVNETSNDFHFELLPIHNKVRLPELPMRDLKRSMGLLISLQMMREDYNITISNEFSGFYIILHDSFELPSSSSKTYVLNRDENIEIKINPQEIVADESILNFDPIE